MLHGAQHIVQRCEGNFFRLLYWSGELNSKIPSLLTSKGIFICQRLYLQICKSEECPVPLPQTHQLCNVQRSHAEWSCHSFWIGFRARLWLDQASVHRLFAQKPLCSFWSAVAFAHSTKDIFAKFVYYCWIALSITYCVFHSFHIKQIWGKRVCSFEKPSHGILQN